MQTVSETADDGPPNYLLSRKTIYDIWDIRQLERFHDCPDDSFTRCVKQLGHLLLRAHHGAFDSQSL